MYDIDIKNPIISKKEIVKYINTLKDYEGYVQFSHRSIEKKDIFIDQSPKVENEEGFIYEAHFFNGNDSISIKQINDKWLVSTIQLSEIDNKKSDIQIYKSIAGDIKMAQIWIKDEDEYCANMKVKKLKKVVFAGFENG